MKQFLIFSFCSFFIQFYSLSQKTKVAYFGSGCFWCVEAIFETVKGVKEAESGYCGGTTKNPTYEQICTGKTGHAETVKITYDPKKHGLISRLKFAFLAVIYVLIATSLLIATTSIIIK